MSFQFFHQKMEQLKKFLKKLIEDNEKLEHKIFKLRITSFDILTNTFVLYLIVVTFWGKLLGKCIRL